MTPRSRHIRPATGSYQVFKLAFLGALTLPPARWLRAPPADDETAAVMFGAGENSLAPAVKSWQGSGSVHVSPWQS